ncbi:DUF350 domain-containing protein [Alteromonas ponticola]|uniref:DUF350 domain-containing protein n=1 Tax=Alteromonas ponticola TaxID=2720613 RepID=A0ABX1R1L3_9ALTE|nr:DUF350 domain-containing protein [Alteromonas ponticola]NMH59080.1 DUF350 domain-containing protein [Alteromonas ponticola]
METLVKMVDLPSDLWVYLVIDLGLALILLLLLKLMAGAFKKSTVTEELGVKDNFAFGISIAGGMLSLCIVLSSVVGRHVGMGYEEAALGMVTFGLVGIILVKFGRFAHDKLVLDRIDSQAMISDRSVSVALIDASSLIASAIILRSMMIWVDGSDANAIIAITTGFLVVLAVLLVLTRLIEKKYAKGNQNDSFQGALRKGQLALAIEHSGNLLGTATIVASAGSLLKYDPEGYVSNVSGWLAVSVVLTVSLMLLVSLSKQMILFGMDHRQEIDHQHNVGVACVAMTLSIGIALIVNGVLSFLG